jgi:starvation-inducible DNA-binding protein
MIANLKTFEKSDTETLSILNTLLSDEHLLFVKTKNYPAGVEVNLFHDFHLFFNRQAEAIKEIMDSIAEQLGSMGHFSMGSMNQILSLAHLLDHEIGEKDGLKLILNLLNDHEAIINVLRMEISLLVEDHNFVETYNFLTGILEKHEEMAWMLRTCL